MRKTGRGPVSCCRHHAGKGFSPGFCAKRHGFSQYLNSLKDLADRSIWKPGSAETEACLRFCAAARPGQRRCFRISWPPQWRHHRHQSDECATAKDGGTLASADSISLCRCNMRGWRKPRAPLVRAEMEIRGRLDADISDRNGGKPGPKPALDMSPIVPKRLCSCIFSTK